MPAYRDHPAEEALVYMVTGTDGNGDTHVFVSMNRERAESKLDAMRAGLLTVEANWLEGEKTDDGRVSAIMPQFRSEITRPRRADGLTTADAIVAALLASDEPRTVASIAAQIKCQTGMVSDRCKRLLEIGIIERSGGGGQIDPFRYSVRSSKR